MIIEWLFGMMTGILVAFMELFPAVDWDFSAGSAMAQMAGAAGLWNGYFPVLTLGMCLGAVIAVKVFGLGYRLVFFIYHQFWGSE